MPKPIALHSASSIIEQYEEGEAPPTDILIGGLHRNRRKIYLAIVLTLAAALAYLAITKPAYTASASLFVDLRNPKVVTSDAAIPGYNPDAALVESQVAIIGSRSVLKRAIEDLRLVDDPDFSELKPSLLSRIKSLVVSPPPPATAADRALDTLSRTVRVKRAANTYVIDIEVTASTPEKAARIVQGVLTAYLTDQMEAKSADEKRANALINARLDELRADVRGAEARYDDYKRANTILTSEGIGFTEQQLSKLNGELATARSVVAETRARNEQIQSTLTSALGAGFNSEALKSPLVQRLRDQYAQVARREASLSAQLQPRHPVLVDVRSQLTEMKNQIDAELVRVSAAAANDYQVALKRERAVAAELEKVKHDVTRIQTAEIKAREIQQEVTTSRELMRQFLQRAKETSEQEKISTPDARVISAPSIPTRPSKPSFVLVLGLGLAGGLSLGLAWALLAHHLDDTVQSPAQLAAEFGPAQIAAIPMLPPSHIASGSTAGLVRIPEAKHFRALLQAIAHTTGHSEGRYRQSILRLLSRITASRPTGQPHTVMIASPRHGVGNSATALALAYAAALNGERVLLVDSASSNPELSKIFATTLQPTTVIKLDNKDHLNQITTRDPGSGLAFLPIALAELRNLKTDQRRRLVNGLRALSQNYDLVVIDAGGILEDEAAASLLPVADQVMVLARQGTTTVVDLIETLEAVRPANERHPGPILTLTNSSSA